MSHTLSRLSSRLSMSDLGLSVYKSGQPGEAWVACTVDNNAQTVHEATGRTVGEAIKNLLDAIVDAQRGGV